MRKQLIFYYFRSTLFSLERFNVSSFAFILRLKCSICFRNHYMIVRFFQPRCQDLFLGSWAGEPRSHGRGPGNEVAILPILRFHDFGLVRCILLHGLCLFGRKQSYYRKNRRIKIGVIGTIV